MGKYMTGLMRMGKNMDRLFTIILGDLGINICILKGS